ncbi:MAG: hypothetical protein UT30_C0011G0003 [Candidatus Uhrbacteria bacterium GW2011_GWF2_39_13]|uniref:Metallo-beta-lactamase domain-containing protein n=1 Tax=Candidatus Uhrbacteria bacterium GW2011_GWF2_39_13 TaxID=1618995 RepID=A0A0G0QRC5_9BACT|nr:MAG: hypothetical protein UT30_C0011G0003 [Candidatus Uhrbacteria bacterium GW2011_GWF2_39_13]
MSRAKPKQHFFSAPFQAIILVVAVFGLSIGLWIYHSQFFIPWVEQPLRVWMLDVGQGDAFLIEFPTGEQWLIDGGPDNTLLTKLGSILPPWDRSINAMILTHADTDHVTGLVCVLDRYDIGTVYESGVRAHTQPDNAFVSQLKTDEEFSHKKLQAGEILVIGDVRLTVLWPDELFLREASTSRNNFSIVIQLDYGQTSILFTGDTEEELESIFGSRSGDIDVLKIGHHGSLTSTSWSFLNQVHPEMAFLSLGADNDYGHPHPTILQRLQEQEVQIFRTDQDGDVLLTSYGGEPIVESHPLPF